MRLMAAKRSSNRFRSLLGVSLAVLTLVGNLLADVCYAFADPRIRIS